MIDADAPSTQGPLSGPLRPGDGRVDVLGFATQGGGSNDETRLRFLLSSSGSRIFDFRRDSKVISAVRLIRSALARPPRLIVMEGTGFAGGVALIILRLWRGVPYIVSSGDAIGPYLGSRSPVLGALGACYERILCRLSAGFVAWTPYLAGRALTFGAPRAMTAPGWQPESGVEVTPTDHWREALRARLGIAGDDIVFGIVGSIEWTRRRSYCYGLELVAALGRVERSDIVVVVVGDGSGLTHLKELAGRASSRVVFPGRVPREEVPLYLRAMDIASLPQSVDGVGAFRYTTKVSEYLAAGLPLVTGEIPLSYDLDIPGWRLPGDAPWSPSYVEALSSLMNRVTRADLDEMTGRPADLDSLFDAERQRRQVSSFVGDTLRRLS